MKLKINTDIKEVSREDIVSALRGLPDNADGMVTIETKDNKFEWNSWNAKNLLIDVTLPLRGTKKVLLEEDLTELKKKILEDIEKATLYNDFSPNTIQVHYVSKILYNHFGF